MSYSKENNLTYDFPTAWVLAFAVAAILLRAFFCLYTHRTWEDALTVVRDAENAARGLGLSLFHPDEPPAQSFTSPLSVLVPLIGELMHSGFGLTFIKLVSVPLSGMAVWFGARIAWQWNLRPPLVVMVAGFLAIEHHQILWGAAGMETQMAVLALLFSVWCLLNPNPLRTGVSLGVCLLARPDFIIWDALAIGFLVFQSRREDRTTHLTKVIAAASAVYGPWLIFATIYYGNPIPNSIIAKFYGYLRGARPSMTTPHAIGSRVGQLFATLGTAFGGHGGGFMPIHGGRLIECLMLVLLLIGGCVCIRRRHNRCLPVFLFVAAYCLYVVFLLPGIFGWYTVPVAALAIVGAAYGVDAVISALPSGIPRNRFAVIFAACYLATFALALLTTIPAEKNIQLYVEDGIRRRVGEYIYQVSSPNDTVGCEALGYFGYYSRRSVYDFPGLGRRRVVDFLRNHPDKRRLDYMLEHFRPTYIVLRKRELDEFTNGPADSWLHKDYSVEKEFAISPEGRSRLLAPERSIDLYFLVLRKIS